jgi:hypothetical protein
VRGIKTHSIAVGQIRICQLNWRRWKSVGVAANTDRTDLRYLIMLTRLRFAIEKALNAGIGNRYAFDFDNTVAKYKGWKGVDYFEDEFISATVEVIRRLKKEGATIIFNTVRGDTAALRKWLKDRDIPFDSIEKKPISLVYVDDRGLNFHGQSAEQLYKDIKAVEKSAEKVY